MFAQEKRSVQGAAAFEVSKNTFSLFVTCVGLRLIHGNGISCYSIEFDRLGMIECRVDCLLRCLCSAVVCTGAIRYTQHSIPRPNVRVCFGKIVQDLDILFALIDRIKISFLSCAFSLKCSS